MEKIPNILTLIRLLIIPVFPLMFWFDSINSRWFFLALFILASITDFLDGFIARKFNIISTFGRVFDSIADKSLIIIVCIMLLLKDFNLTKFILFPIIALILRELIVSGIREGVSSQIIIKSSWIGKYKTTFQMISLSFLIVGGFENLWYSIFIYVGVVLLYISIVLSLISGFQYLMQSYELLINKKEH